MEEVKRNQTLLMPVGISFYTFQTAGYLIDVYRGNIQAEKNFLIYGLFAFFFPSVVSGPIGRAGELIPQFRDLKTKRLWNWERILKGLLLMLWGFFLKLVIADRIALFVNEVFDSYWLYGTVELLGAAFSYSIQLYCDFASYSFMALGAAKIVGIELIDNFNVPYFAKSIPEFWHRWHISLSTWLRDYVYIPLGGSRCSAFRNRVNLMITFLVSGIWHGANWTYLLWGGMHGIYQVIGKGLKPVKAKLYRKLGIQEEWTGIVLGKVLITFLLTTLAWIFFRAPSILDGFQFLERICTKWNPEVWIDHSWKYLGLDPKEWVVLGAALLILLAVDCIRYFGKLRIDEFVMKQSFVIRLGIIYVLLFMTLLYGVYGQGYDASQFIYFQF
ncbi:MAG: MBOAT family O-acyltransferase [Candidatus Limivivens sp.]|nr:MBOAT family O-acyltransferase [Candidatus Limivivens sp.]